MTARRRICQAQLAAHTYSVVEVGQQGKQTKRRVHGRIVEKGKITHSPRYMQQRMFAEFNWLEV